MSELSPIDPGSAALLVMDYQVDTLTTFMTSAQSAGAIACVSACQHWQADPAGRCSFVRLPARRLASRKPTKGSTGAVSATLAIDAVVDSNVIIAALAGDHEHHAASADLFSEEQSFVLGLAAHSYAEVYSTLTRRGAHAPFRFPAEEAWAALESVRAATE
jgi:hypothetical protein